MPDARLYLDVALLSPQEGVRVLLCKDGRPYAAIVTLEELRRIESTPLPVRVIRGWVHGGEENEP